MTDAITTIQFNTGRKYTAEGQIITATLYADGVVTFMDHSRMISGELVRQFPADTPRADMQGIVDTHYMTGDYIRTKRADHDGMMKGGRNTRDGYEALTKIKALPTPEATRAHGLTAMDNLLADFCGSLDLPRESADEVLAKVAAERHGAVGGAMREWLMDFIVQYEREVEDVAEPEHFYAFGNGAVDLFDSASQSEVRGWIKGYTRAGDFGGYGFITLEDAKGNVLEAFEKPEGDEPTEDDGVAAQYPDHLDAGEREIIDALICAALERGYEVRVRGLIPFTTDYQLITQHVAATDEEHLMFRKVGDDMPAGHVFLVHGNLPSEVIADHTDNLLIGELYDVVRPIIERLDDAESQASFNEWSRIVAGKGE